MRPLEIFTPILLAIYLLWPLTGKKRPSAVGLLPAFALVVIGTHAQVEGLRWQMIPLYAFSAVMLLISIPSFLRLQTETAPTVRPLRVILSLGLLAISTALPILLPVPIIPTPSGPYPIGTRIYELTDESRKELYSGKDEARRFQIQVWYPSEVDVSAEHSPWIENSEVFAPIYSEYIGFPSFALDHLVLAKVPAYKETKIAPTDIGFPVIIYSHGWNGFSGISTAQALHLASHGYIVVSMQHTYGAIVTVFEDGTIAENYPDALPKGAPDDEYEVAAHKLVDQWAGDIAYALDFLTDQYNDANSPLYKAFDLSRVGVYGHSTGSGAAIQFCGTDDRCKALLGQDPFMRPVSIEVQEKGIAQPSFFMFSQTWRDNLNSRNNMLFSPFYGRSADTFGAVYIQGTDHLDFIDLPLLSPLAPQFGLKGPINGKRVTMIVNDYLLSFFDATLQGAGTELFEKPSPYSEVRNKQ